MQRCFISARNRWGTIIGFVGFQIIGVYLGSCGIWIASREHDANGACILLLLFGCFICGFGIFQQAIYSRRFRLDEDGITIEYLKKFTVKYPWSTASHICVCDVNHVAKTDDSFDIVIRITIGSERRGPFSEGYLSQSNKFEPWRKMEYNAIHYRKIILIEYTETRLKEIAQVSKRKIPFLLTDLGKTAIHNIH